MFEFSDKLSDFVTERDFLLQIPTGVASKSKLLFCYQGKGISPATSATIGMHS